MLSFLRIRAVVNGKDIYPLLNTKPIVITVHENNPRVVITDGFHITRPLKLVYHQLDTYCFKVGCIVNDIHLLTGFILLAGLYLAGFYTGLLVLKVFSFLPLIYFILVYYLNRREFIRMIPV